MKSFNKKLISVLLIGGILTGCSTSTEDISGYVKDKAKQEASNMINDTLDKVFNSLEVSTDTDSPVNDTVSSNEFDQIPAKLAKHVDGDTTRLYITGDTFGAKTGKDGSVSLRYLLIDTPETVDPRLDGPQPFGVEASQRTEELLESGNITIEFDIGEKTDKYGRLLAYVYVDGVSIQETLVREGLARVAYVYPPNTRHLDTYKRAEEQAKKEGIGIWSIENYAESQFKEH